MRAKRRLIRLIATLMSACALLVAPVVSTSDGFHDMGHVSAPGFASPNASTDGFHDM